MKLPLLLFLLNLIVSGPVTGTDTWRSPKGANEVSLKSESTPAGDLDKLTVNDSGLTILANSNIRRENHGYGWMKSAEAKWVDDRFLVFKDESGLAIIDVKTSHLLLNQVLTGYSESPDGQKWAAIRRRNVPRKQDSLTGSEEDTLWFLDPNLLAESSEGADNKYPFAHIPAVQTGGIVLAPPEWSEDGTSIILTVLSGGNILRDIYSVNSHKRIGSTTVKDPGLSREQLLSLGFQAEVKDAILHVLAPGQSADSSKNSLDLDLPRPSRRGAASEQQNAAHSAERAIPSKRVLWGTIAIVCIAAIVSLIRRFVRG